MPSTTSLLLNGAAIIVGVASLGAVLRAAFIGEQLPSCKERFTNATRFSLEHNGALITSEGLQSEAANTDWGLNNSGARAVKLKSGPSRHALELDLASVSSVSREHAERAGMGFHWLPDALQSPKAVCLSYSVFVPEGFVFGRGGRLPGILGASTNEGRDPTTTFSTRYTWNERGEMDVYPHFPNITEGRSLGGNRGTFALTAGKWTEFDQEVTLNSAGQNDGTLRVWQDGSLVYEKKNVVFRTKPSVAVTGVLAEAVAGEVSGGAPRGPQKVWLSPFEMRWK